METTANLSDKTQKCGSFTCKYVIKKEGANNQKTDFSKNNDTFRLESEKKQEPKKKVRISVGLGVGCGDLYFTKREAECVVWLLKGKKFSEIATILNLSSRTVEYYMKNIKAKVGCRTKLELTDLVQASDFKKNVGFQQ
jgi:DNA-binding CsgD family transcriptional regulator